MPAFSAFWRMGVCVMFCTYADKDSNRLERENASARST